MEFYIESSKTDQFRDGAWVEIACTCTELCPVGTFERYAKLAALGQDQEKLIFCGIVSTKSDVRLHTPGSLSYTRIREMFLKKLVEIGLDKSKYGLHSLHAGGASAAANAGIPDSWFKCHRCWRSENTKDGYVKDTLEERLEVMQHLVLRMPGIHVHEKKTYLVGPDKLSDPWTALFRAY